MNYYDEPAPPSCPICLDGRSPELCAVECPETRRRQEARAEIAYAYVLARTALRLARIYRAEEGPHGRRESECMEAVFERRREIAALRKSLKKEETTMDETIESILGDVKGGVRIIARGGHFEARDEYTYERGFGASVLDALRSLRSANAMRAERMEVAE